MGPIKVNSIAELRKMTGNPEVSLDGIVEEVDKGKGHLSIKDENLDVRPLNCLSIGGALLGKEITKGNKVNVTGDYYPNDNSYNERLLLKGIIIYQTSINDSELPQ